MNYASSALVIVAIMAASSAYGQGSMVNKNVQLRTVVQSSPPCADADIDQGTRTVGEGAEWTNLVDAAGVDIISVFIDISADEITFDYEPAGSGAFCSGIENTYVFSDADGSVPDILGVSIDADTTTLGIQPEDVSFTSDEIRVNVEGLSYSPMAILRLRLVLGPDPCPADTNGNGVADPGDFTAWIAAYNSGDLVADANQNGELDPGDFTAWVAAYNLGC